MQKWQVCFQRKGTSWVILATVNIISILAFIIKQKGERIERPPFDCKRTQSNSSRREVLPAIKFHLSFLFPVEGHDSNTLKLGRIYGLLDNTGLHILPRETPASSFLFFFFFFVVNSLMGLIHPFSPTIFPGSVFPEVHCVLPFFSFSVYSCLPCSLFLPTFSSFCFPLLFISCSPCPPSILPYCLFPVQSVCPRLSLSVCFLLTLFSLLFTI